MFAAIVEWVKAALTTVKVDYGVDPLIYFILSCACTPPVYISLFFMMRALARKDWNRVITFASICLFAFALPSIYALVFGHNLPWWIWALAVLLVLWYAFTLVLRIRKVTHQKS